MSNQLMVGVRYNGTIDIDMADSDEPKDWNFNNIDVEQAEFLVGELTNAITRAKARIPKLIQESTPGPYGDMIK